MSGRLNIKWNDGELSRRDVLEWVKDREGLVTGEADLRHVAHMLYDFYLDSRGKRTLGHSLRAMKNNDFRSAVARADGSSRSAIALFQMFLDNVAPSSYGEN